MKQIFLCMVVSLCLISFISCNNDEENDVDLRLGSVPEKSINIDNRFELILSKTVFDPSNMHPIKAIVANHSEEEIVTGVDYHIEYYRDSKWYEVPFPENFYFTDIGLIVKPNGTNSFNISFFPDNYKYKSGKYRVCKYIAAGGERHWIAAEFTVK